MDSKDNKVWFEDARFGMFIHWGLYSILGRGEWVMYYERVPVEEYTLLANKFKPDKFEISKWVELAQKTGVKYIVFTTRHHDGFSLFDSKVSEFTSVRTAAKRDFVAEYVKACRKAGMKIGFYYSLTDWRFPVAYIGPKKDPKAWSELREYVHAQVKELCTQYGKIDILWYDGGFYIDSSGNWKTCSTTAEDWGSEELNAMVRRYQPDILINNRSHLPEDFDTPEQAIIPSEPGRLWETCMTMNMHWGYYPSDNHWKSTKLTIQDFSACVGSGGNFLLNVGPKPDGSIPVQSVRILNNIGKWMKVNSESIYGCSRAPFGGGSAGHTTAKDNTVYMHPVYWPGTELCIPDVKIKMKSAYLLATGQKVQVVQKGEHLFLCNLPRKAPDPYDSVIVLKK